MTPHTMTPHTMTPHTMTPTLRPRQEPLAPKAVAAVGATSRLLAARLLRLDEPRLAALSVVHGEGLLVALGPEGSLPWVPGVVYLGSEREAPALLMPTTRALSVSTPLVERALRRRFSCPTGALAVLPDDRVVSLLTANPIGRAALTRLVGASP